MQSFYVPGSIKINTLLVKELKDSHRQETSHGLTVQSDLSSGSAIKQPAVSKFGMILKTGTIIPLLKCEKVASTCPNSMISLNFYVKTPFFNICITFH